MQNRLSLRARQSFFSHPPPPGRRQCNSTRIILASLPNVKQLQHIKLTVPATVGSWSRARWAPSWARPTPGPWTPAPPPIAEASIMTYLKNNDDCLLPSYYPHDDDDGGDLHSIERCAWAGVASLISTTAATTFQHLQSGGWWWWWWW